MPSSELRNIATLGWHGLKVLARGEFPEALATAEALTLRVGENIVEPFGRKAVTCGFCGWQGRRFRTFVTGPFFRRNAVCPRCLSLERHRAFLPLFQAVRALLPGAIRVLDIAPMRAFSDHCRRTADVEYLSIDLESPVAMRHMDIQDLQLPDGHFDIVVCYHVLDYVPDDRRALLEIWRVMSPTGIGILEEGLGKGPTVEWGEARREELYRIRQYGDDFPDRLREAGFHYVKVMAPGRRTPTFLVSRTPRPELEDLSRRAL